MAADPFADPAPMAEPTDWAALVRAVRERAAAVAPAPRAVTRVLIPTPAQLAAGVRIIDAEDGQIPAAARRLRDAALGAGWLVRCTYALAEGEINYRTREVGAIETVAVRLYLWSGRRGFALWRNGKYAMAMMVDAGQLRQLGAREVLAFVRGGQT